MTARQQRAKRLVEAMLEGDAQPGYDVPPVGVADTDHPEEESREVKIALEIKGLARDGREDDADIVGDVLQRIEDLADELLQLHDWNDDDPRFGFPEQPEGNEDDARDP